jgi:aryl-alcohol dehydrogenase-like predicted oxidoreductase
MRYRLLGKTGLNVSEICLGTVTYGGTGFWESVGTLTQDAVNDQVRTALDAGINFIDTANTYSLGESERLLGGALKALAVPREKVVIATKASGAMDDSPNGRGQSRYHLMNALDDSLRRLRLDHVDLYQLHGFDPLTPLEDVLSTLDDMVRSGKVRYVGLSNMMAWQVMKGLAISDRRGCARFACIQAYYTIAGRDLERELVPLIQDQGLGLMVWSPLAGGLLTGKFTPDGAAPAGTRRAALDFPVVDKPRAFRCVDAMRPIAQRHGVSIAQVAIAWLLGKPFVSTVIIGARTPEQLMDNIAAARVQLSAEDIQVLDDVSQLPPEYPAWMLAFQGQRRALGPVGN